MARLAHIHTLVRDAAQIVSRSWMPFADSTTLTHTAPVATAMGREIAPAGRCTR